MRQLLATLDRFENDKAVLILPDGQTLLVNRNNLDADLEPGAVIYINFSVSPKETAQKEKLAKNLLKKIFKQNS
jgi:hypothetical protein